MACKGLRVHGIDIVANHIQWARYEIQACALESTVSVSLMDFHHLDSISSESFDGLYAMESFFHTTDPGKALGEFFRMIRPGGSVALYYYDYKDDSSQGLAGVIKGVNEKAAMSSDRYFIRGMLQNLLRE